MSLLSRKSAPDPRLVVGDAVGETVGDDRALPTDRLRFGVGVWSATLRRPTTSFVWVRPQVDRLCGAGGVTDPRPRQRAVQPRVGPEATGHDAALIVLR